LGTERQVSDRVKQEAEIAVEELRLFLSLYDGIDVQPGSRMGRQLETARKAVAAYELVEARLGAQTA
jgi:hypothetical protein